jgi:hypothetical protein
MDKDIRSPSTTQCDARRHPGFSATSDRDRRTREGKRSRYGWGVSGLTACEDIQVLC